MKKKILAIILAMVMMMCCFSGCALVFTDAEKDMAQPVAEVDISQSEEFQTGGEYEDYKDVIQPMSISKRELVAYFVNAGYSYVSQGMSYKDTLGLLVDSMVNYKIILQYAMVYFFEESKDENSEYYQVYSVNDYKSFVGDAKDSELSLKTLEYFLNKDVDKTEYTDAEGKTVSYTRYQKAEYTLKQSINSAIDSQESKYIVATEGATSSSTESRAVPTGANTVNADYYDPNYAVYTGTNSLANCGSYEKVEGSTSTTRKQAYNSFLSMLSNNYLITKDELTAVYSDEEGKGLASLAYYQAELLTQLESALSEKLTDAFETKAASEISADYLSQRYTERFQTQQKIYDKDSSSFETDLGSVSDSSFVLYAPEGADEDDDKTKYGFVYNILLPFSTQQTYKLSEYKNAGLSEVQMYEERASLLEQIEGKDQRAPWFNGATDYSFIASEKNVTPYSNGNNSNYLFFKESLTETAGENARYEALEKYYGYYPYNGTVIYNVEKNEYKLTPNKLNITNFLVEMEGYMNWALEKEGYSNRAIAKNGSLTYNDKTFSLTNGYTDTYSKNLLGTDGKIDYSKFVYYVGQVGGLNVSANNLLVNNNAAYTALSAFNELQFAYSTDTGCLNTYLGYSISRYSTSYVGEFEYAAKLAVSQGVGTYTVCPSDYGWHIIYCTYAFDQGSVYGDIDWTQFATGAKIDEDKLTENSFEYFFYESIKANTVSGYQTALENKKINVYNTDTCVTVYENRYSDYSRLENTIAGSSNN